MHELYRKSEARILALSLVASISIAACAGNNEVPAIVPDKPVPTYTVEESPNDLRIYGADGIRINRININSEDGGFVVYNFCDDEARLVTSGSSDKTNLPAITSRSEPFDGCEDGFFSESDMKPGTIIRYVRDADDPTSLAALMDMYSTELSTTDDSKLNAFYNADGSAAYSFGTAALHSAYSLIFFCAGSDRQTLTVTRPETSFESGDGTLRVYVPLIDSPSEGSDVCADGKVTLDDHIETRPEIIFEV